MKIPESYTALLERYGRPLADLGVKDVGLSREHALDAIDILRTNKIPIVGGDVLKITENRPRYVGDNWYVNRHPDEDADEYIKRSHEKADQFIRSYRDPNDGSILYALVISERGLLTGR